MSIICLGSYAYDTLADNDALTLQKGRNAYKARFYYSLDGLVWTAIGNELKMNYTLPHFMGYRFGLFNYAIKTGGGYADFDYFRIN